jgi:TolB-like protein
VIVKCDQEESGVCFGEFSAKLKTGQIYRGTERLVLQNKPFQILEILLRSAGSFVSREQIQQAIWPDVHVDSRQCLNTAVRKLRKALGDNAANPSLIETVGSRGYRLMIEPLFPENMRRESVLPEETLAVIPFQNLNGADDDYFSSGLTEQMIAELGRHHQDLAVIAPLGVIDRSGSSPASSNLQTCYVLSKSTFRINRRFRITAKLVRFSDRVCLWSDSFTRDVIDIFKVQDEIAQQIAIAIGRALPISLHRRASLTTMPAIYDKYLETKYFVAKGTEPDFSKAVRLFEQVISEDPIFAPAYGSLAMLYTAAGQYGVLPPKIFYGRVHALATQALKLDPELPEAHAAFGFKSLFCHADFASAETELLYALTANRSCVAAHLGYGFFQIACGCHEASIEAMSQAARLEPLSLMNNVLVATALCIAGRLQKALV